MHLASMTNVILDTETLQGCRLAGKSSRTADCRARLRLLSCSSCFHLLVVVLNAATDGLSMTELASAKDTSDQESDEDS